MPTLDPYSEGGESLTGLASVWAVVRYHEDAEGDDRFEFLPNVVCEQVDWRKGPHVPTARFRYILDDGARGDDNPFPYLMEDLWPLAAEPGPYVVLPDDRLLVYEHQGDERRLLFDGYAGVPQVDGQYGQATTFTASGVGVRLWDQPIRAAAYRNSDEPETGDPIATERPVWFNPANKPNATADTHDVNEGAENAYPVFLDASLPKLDGTDPEAPAFWTLGGFVRYLCWRENEEEKYVRNPVSPTGVTLDDYLQSIAPKGDSETMDPTDPSTYDAKPIVIRSFDATGKPLLVALDEQLEYYGFSITLNLREDEDGTPINELIVYRTDGRDGNAPIDLYFPPAYSSLSDGIPDFDGINFARDTAKVVNAVRVETAPEEIEASFVLAPGFTPDSADAASASAMKPYDEAQLRTASADARKKYRYYVFDECGLGHWKKDTSTFVTGTPTSLDDLFGSPDAHGVPQYANLPRPGDTTCCTLGEDGLPRKAELAISYDYAGPSPGVWDGSGTWQSLGQSGWKLDPKFLAAWLTAENPENWRVPKGAVVKGDVVRAISQIANPTSGRPYFFLRLTTKIRADKGIEAVADRRTASPASFYVERVIDARDHWVKRTASRWSAYNTSGGEVVVRDDKDKAKAQAEAQRAATEFPPVAGAVTMPWIGHAIGIGDSIGYIEGREIDLNQAGGEEAGEGPRYPNVVGVTWTRQPPTTTIHLSDHRTVEAASHGFGAERRRRRVT